MMCAFQKIQSKITNLNTRKRAHAHGVLVHDIHAVTSASNESYMYYKS